MSAPTFLALVAIAAGCVLVAVVGTRRENACTRAHGVLIDGRCVDRSVLR